MWPHLPLRPRQTQGPGGAEKVSGSHTTPTASRPALLPPPCPSPVREGGSTIGYEGWGELVTPGLPHWGPDSPSAPQVASGPDGVEGVAVGVRSADRHPQAGGSRGPFPPELNPNTAEKGGAKGKRGKQETKPKPQPGQGCKLRPPAQELAGPDTVLSPRPRSPEDPPSRWPPGSRSREEKGKWG